MQLGIEVFRYRLSKSREEFQLISAIQYVAADIRRLLLIPNHKKMSIREEGRVRKRSFGFLMLEFAVNDGRYSCLRIPVHVLPDIQHGPAGRIDDDAALFRQKFHF